jgi:hypothetical protein
VLNRAEPVVMEEIESALTLILGLDRGAAAQ